MQLLITGGSGLVGWDLSHRAASAGHDIAYTYYSTRPPTTDRSLEAHQVDIREADAVRKVVRRVNPDVVVHAAAMTDVDECERQPDRATAINVEGTRNVVDACRPTNASLLFVSTFFVDAAPPEICSSYHPLAIFIDTPDKDCPIYHRRR
jgi:dTDP-4-dehydrorhamnose reductase